VGDGPIRVEGGIVSCRSARAFMGRPSPRFLRLPLPGDRQRRADRCRHESGSVLTGGHVRRLVRPPIDPRPRRPRSGPPARPRRCAAIRGGAGDADHRRERAAPAFSASRRAARDRGALRRNCHGLVCARGMGPGAARAGPICGLLPGATLELSAPTHRAAALCARTPSGPAIKLPPPAALHLARS
jgi:hypothetical protein